MAGKFLSLEEAARRLGVSVDEVNRLVDRKELFPMRAGGSIKFKVDDIERKAADLGSGGGEAEAGSGDLDLDLDLDFEASAPALEAAGSSPAAAAPGTDDDELVLGEPDDAASIFGSDATEGSSPTSVREGETGDAAAASAAFEDDLALDSIIGASSPALPAGDSGVAESPPTDSGVPDSGTLAIDLSNVGGSVAGLSNPSGLGDSLAGPTDSGLSLEGDAIDVSGIDLAAGDDLGLGAEEPADAPLAGDAFELGAGIDDEESASVVIPTEETGDSSFFETVEDASSASFEDASGSLDVPGFESQAALGRGGSFSVWQVVGLVSCTLLMFLAGLVVFDVLTVVRSPDRSPISTPLLQALAQTFGW